MALDLNALVDDAVKQARPKLAMATHAVPQGLTIQGVAAGGPAKFCELWPIVKTALEILQTAVPAAAIIVGIVVRIGDGICKS